MLRIYPVEFSCVGGVYSPVGCRDPVSNSAANGIEVGHDDMHDAARCVFVNIGVNRVTSSFAFGKIGKMRLNRKQKKRVAAIFMLRLLRKHARSGKQESPAVADKPARRLRKVFTVYVRAVGLL